MAEGVDDSRLQAPAEPARGWVRIPASGSGTFVDRGAEFEGTLQLASDFRIDSEFRGTIVCEARVTVGETADLDADIRAREVVIAGAVHGSVRASRQVVLLAGARLKGDIEAPCLEIEKGALFNGRTQMVNPVVAARTRVVPQPAPVSDGPSSSASPAPARA